MAYVVTPACHKCKYTDCVAVCPVDCFFELDTMLVINPDECIDCGACEPECPTTAIFEEADLPDQWEDMIEFNAKMSGASDPSYHGIGDYIGEQKAPLPNADHFASVDKSSAEIKQHYGV